MVCCFTGGRGYSWSQPLRDSVRLRTLRSGLVVEMRGVETAGYRRAADGLLHRRSRLQSSLANRFEGRDYFGVLGRLDGSHV